MSDFHKKKQEKQMQTGYFYTNAQIRALEERACRRGIEEGLHILLGLVCMTDKATFRFGKGRCTTHCDRILHMFARMDTPGGPTLADVKKAAFELGNVKTIL